VQKQTLGEVGTEQSFGGKLCQEYSYQKLSKSGNWFSSYSQKCWGCFFETQCIFIPLNISLPDQSNKGQHDLR